MKKLLNTLLISTAFIYCYNAYSSNINTIYYDALTSSYDNICNYKIDENKTIINPISNNETPNTLYGALYEEKDNIKYYLIDNKGKYYFDLQTKIEEVTENNKELKNFTEGGNLIVKKCDINNNTCTLKRINIQCYINSNTGTLNRTNTYYDNNFNICTLKQTNTQCNDNTYTLKQSNTQYDYLTVQLLADTTLIIPSNMTLNNKDVILKFCCNNGTVLLLGTLQNTMQTFSNNYFINTCKNMNFTVIIGPQAKYNYENKSLNSLIKLFSPTLHNIVLYPGCTITCENNIHNNNTSIKHTGNLYLNRYTKPDDTVSLKIKGTIDDNIHVIYPAEYAVKNSKWKLGYGLKTDLLNNDYMTTAYFPALYWKKNDKHEYSQDGIGKYHFEDICSPIEFIDDNNGNKVLMLNSNNNKFSQYDVKLWDQCKISNGKYSFQEFVNIQKNTDKYINVENIEDLFMDGKQYKQVQSKYNVYGLLNNMPNTIYNGLMGSKNIVIHENNGGLNTCTIYGDISKYKGLLCFLPGITTVSFPNNNIETIERKISKRKFKYTGISSDNIVSVVTEQFGSSINTIDVKNANGGISKYKSTDPGAIRFRYCFNNDDKKQAIEYLDDISHLNSYNEEGIIWNTDILEDCFINGNTYNPSNNNTPGLLNNIPINNLHNKLNLDLCGNRDITLYSIKENDSVTFSGDNTEYNGIVYVSPNITKIYFNNEDSKVKIDTGAKKYTVLVNNELQVQNKYNSNIKILYNNGIITSDISCDDINVLHDNRESISSIEKYNKNGVIWNTNNLEECFTDSKGLLLKLQDIIHSNLSGNKDIKINTSKNEIKLYGDNSKYNGTITVPQNVNKIYLSTNSLVKIKHEGHNDLSRLTYYLLGNNNWDINKFSNEIYMNLDNTTNKNTSGDLIITDSNNNVKEIKFYGNNSKYNGQIIVPSNDIQIYSKYKLLSKIKYIKHYDLPKENYHLLNNTNEENNNPNNIKLKNFINNRNNNNSTVLQNNVNNTNTINNVINIDIYNKKGVDLNINKLETNNIDTYNRKGMDLNIDTLGTNNSNNFVRIYSNNKNEINCNLQGSKDIIIYTKENALKINGNNTKFTGRLIIPHNVKRVIFNNNRSYINNIKQLNENGNSIMYIQNTNKPDQSGFKILKSI